MYQEDYKQILPTEKRCIIVSSEDQRVARRVVFGKFKTEKEFEEDYREHYKEEKTRQIISGKEFPVGLVFIADDFGEAGKVPEKHLVEFIRKLSVKNKWSHYPSSSLRDNYEFEHLQQLNVSEFWDDTLPVQEADYVSMFIATLTAVKTKELKTFLVNGKNLSHFEEMLKQIIEPTFGNPDVYITNNFIDWEEIRKIEKINPKVVLLFGNSIITESMANHLIKKDIHIIPPSVTQLGNMLISEGIFNKSREVSESFQLINKACSDLNQSLWRYAENYKVNFYTVVDEIYKAHTDENETSRFRLDYKEIGAMSYRA
jgi:hypothetical protein|tara:strand:+ start:38130 stop:39074 length:945 start_codon:yes stop_codon:yes gene_type:complete